MIFDIHKNVYRNIDLHYWFGDNQIPNGRNEDKVSVYYDFSIDWGDGTKLEYYTNRESDFEGKLHVSQCKHEYKQKGIYRVNIYGELDAIQGQSSIGDNKKSHGIIKCLKGILVPKGHTSPIKYAPASFFGCEALIYLGKNVLDNLLNEDIYSESIDSSKIIKQSSCKSVAHLFDGCKIKKIPNSLLKNCTSLKDASYIFEACDIENVPSDLFANCPNLKYVEHAFHRCDYLTSIPEDLFKNNKDIEDINCCFQGCKNLTSLPETIFDSCCDKETMIDEEGNEKIIKKNRRLLVLDHAVAGEHSVGGYDRTQYIEKIPPLWEWDWSSVSDNPNFSHDGYAFGCTHAENYDIAMEKGWA